MWLSAKAADRRIKRTLYIGRVSNPTAYEIVVFTGDVPGNLPQATRTGCRAAAQTWGEDSATGEATACDSLAPLRAAGEGARRLKAADASWSAQGPARMPTCTCSCTGSGAAAESTF